MTRLELQTFLETVCANVYYVAPPTNQMKYPCIVYNLSDIELSTANNKTYSKRRHYNIEVISKMPDPKMVDSILELSGIGFENAFVADNLQHYALSYVETIK